MKLETNTDELNLFNMSYYGSMIEEMLWQYNIDYNEVDEISKDVALDILYTLFKENGLNCQIEALEVYHPKYYNYESESLNVVITLDKEALNKIFEVENDPHFNEWLKQYYSSYDGFISFYADNIENYKSQSEHKKIITCIFLTMVKNGFTENDYNELSYDFDDRVSEYIACNFEEITEDDEE